MSKPKKVTKKDAQTGKMDDDNTTQKNSFGQIIKKISRVKPPEKTKKK